MPRTLARMISNGIRSKSVGLAGEARLMMTSADVASHPRPVATKLEIGQARKAVRH